MRVLKLALDFVQQHSSAHAKGSATISARREDDGKMSNEGSAGEFGFESLAELLLQRAERQPDDVAFIFHDYSPRAAPGARDVTTFGELVADAKAIAGILQAHGLQGQSTLLLFGSGLDFIRAYCACLLAGSHGVPLRPPLTPEYRRQVASIGKDARARGVLCPAALTSRIRTMLEVEPELRDIPIIAPEHRLSQRANWTDPGVRGDDIALIQYTSGSTGAPKGVVVNHTNLLRNEAAIRDAFGHDSGTIVAGWLPMFHDMGLIGNVLQPLYLGVPSILMDPLAFLQDPLRLLQLISQYHATTSGGPNFGYEVCVNRIQPEDVAALDLSSWSLAYSGAEPVRMHTMRRFGAMFGRAGFRMEAFYPCYGLAEATLFVSGIDKRATPSSLRLDATELAENRVRDVAGDANMAEIVSCGYPRRKHMLKIVDPQALRVCEDGQVGEIWVAGESVARGYLNQPELTREVFQATLSGDEGRHYLRTGDLGFIRDGELYVSGRLKDLIIIRGMNHYPQDIEATASSAHASLRVGCGAAFSIEREGEPQLVLVHEVTTDRFTPQEAEELVTRVRSAIARMHGLQLHDLVLVRARGVPKTSSGKLQRRRCRALYESGSLRRVGEARAQAGA
jgi:acyl-CoA synthetase (AMP-forming)/AMP-acid ligase II